MDSNPKISHLQHVEQASLFSETLLVNTGLMSPVFGHLVWPKSTLNGFYPSAD